jgi:hypothetical protein
MADGYDPDDQVEVIAAIDGVSNNGKFYRAGERLNLHRSQLDAHLAKGCVKLADAAKSQGTPADKQQRGRKNK